MSNYKLIFAVFFCFKILACNTQDIQCKGCATVEETGLINDILPQLADTTS